MNGKLYIASWLYQDDAQVAEYDPTRDLWILRAPLKNLRSAALVAAGNRLFAIGGVTGAQDHLAVTNEVREYDFAKDQWTVRAPLAVARQSPAAAAIAGKLFVAGGSTGLFIGMGAPLGAMEALALAP